MRLWATTSLATSEPGISVGAGCELPSKELLADLDAKVSAAKAKFGAALKSDERGAAEAELLALEAQRIDAARCLPFLASPAGAEAVARWLKRGRLADKKPAPATVAAASAEVAELRATYRLRVQARIEKLEARLASAEDKKDKHRADFYAAELSEAKADLLAIGG